MTTDCCISGRLYYPLGGDLAYYIYLSALRDCTSADLRYSIHRSGPPT